MKLLLATHNQGKVAGLTEMLSHAGIAVLSLDDVNVTFDVEETGTTFLENAMLKATQYAAMTNMLVLADDSGLEIDALNGEPGVYTARYGGANLTQPERNQLVLGKLAEVAEPERTARFRAVLVLCAGDGTVIQTAEGVCEGQIAHAPAGQGGFGYDPIFFIAAQQQTLAEMSSAEKHAISHRGNALRQMLPAIIAQTRANS